MYTEPHAERSGAESLLRGERAYGELKRRLLLGEFPLHLRLGEERLAALVGVSRTPIREALLRLHAEGLIWRGPDGGYLPTIPDVALMRHLYETRIGLELQALHRPARHGTVHDADALERLRDEWRGLAADLDDPDPDPSFVLLDESFHVALADAAGNPVVTDLLRHVNERIRIVRMQDFLMNGRIDTTIAEHLGIVEAVLSGDLSEAEHRFGFHVSLSIAVVEERVARAIARMAGNA